MKKTKHTTVRIPEPQYVKLKEYCSEKGVSISAAINTMIEEHFQGKPGNLQDKLEVFPGMNQAVIEDLQEIRTEAESIRTILCTMAKYGSPKVYKELVKVFPGEF